VLKTDGEFFFAPARISALKLFASKNTRILNIKKPNLVAFF